MNTLGWQLEQPRGFCVYLLRSENKTLYVGRSGNVKSRLRQHGTRFGHTEVLYLPCQTRAQTVKTERKMILALQPVHNQQCRFELVTVNIRLSRQLWGKLKRIMRATGKGTPTLAVRYLIDKEEA